MDGSLPRLPPQIGLDGDSWLGSAPVGSSKAPKWSENEFDETRERLALDDVVDFEDLWFAGKLDSGIGQ